MPAPELVVTETGDGKIVVARGPGGVLASLPLPTPLGEQGNAHAARLAFAVALALALDIPVDRLKRQLMPVEARLTAC